MLKHVGGYFLTEASFKDVYLIALRAYNKDFLQLFVIRFNYVLKFIYNIHYRYETPFCSGGHSVGDSNENFLIVLELCFQKPCFLVNTGEEWF